MNSRRTGFVFLLTTLGLTLIGCGKSDTKPASLLAAAIPARNSSRLISQPSTLQPLAQIHFLGKKRLATETNAVGFMAVWDLAESAKLEAQTLDKLATAPWRLWRPDIALSNAPSALLRPLLDDLVSAESFLKVRDDTNQLGELVLAIRVNAARAALWQTNLAAVMESLTDSKTTPTPTGWAVKFTRQSKSPQSPSISQQLTLSRAGEWTLVGLAANENALLAEFIVRIQNGHTPFESTVAESWLEARLDLRRIASTLALDWELPQNFPVISLAVAGDGQNVRSRGDLDFPQPLQVVLSPWNIPTNLIHDPLIGFSAIRGIGPWLKSMAAWKHVQLESPPNQAFFWAQEGVPWLHFVAMPSAEASNQVAGISDYVLRDLNPIFATESMKMGVFQARASGPGLTWRGIPIFSPNLAYVDVAGQPFIVAGLYPNLSTNLPAPVELIAQVFAATNLLWYDWEITARCQIGLIPMGQLSRRMFSRPRLPIETAGFPWLRDVSPKLGNAVTTVKLFEPNHLSFARASTIGFTAAELSLLIDWLESPRFPQGLYSLDASSTALSLPDQSQLNNLPTQHPTDFTK